MQDALKNDDYDIQDGALLPRYWRDPRFGIARKTVPVVGITWYEANAYCKWLSLNWDDLAEGQRGLEKPGELRLPTEAEWQAAAGGVEPEDRFAWDKQGEVTSKENISLYANTSESGINRTTPVWTYPQGASKPHGLMDVGGNVWEWQANYRNQKEWLVGFARRLVERLLELARVSDRNHAPRTTGASASGFGCLPSPVSFCFLLAPLSDSGAGFSVFCVLPASRRRRVNLEGNL